MNPPGGVTLIVHVLILLFAWIKPFFPFTKRENIQSENSQNENFQDNKNIQDIKLQDIKTEIEATKAQKIMSFSIVTSIVLVLATTIHVIFQGAFEGGSNIEKLLSYVKNEQAQNELSGGVHQEDILRVLLLISPLIENTSEPFRSIRLRNPRENLESLENLERLNFEQDKRCRFKECFLENNVIS